MITINFNILENGIIKSNEGEVLAYFDRNAEILHVNCDRRIYECGSDELAGDEFELCGWVYKVETLDEAKAKIKANISEHRCYWRNF